MSTATRSPTTSASSIPQIFGFSRELSISLEEWARRKDTKVLAISSDGGWKAFADTSDHIVVVEDIAKVFGHFNRSANFIAQRVESLVQRGKIPGIEGQIKALIEEHFDDCERRSGSV